MATNLGFKATLWAAADKFRINMDATEYKQYGYVLTPGRYVGAEDIEDDGGPFPEKMVRLTKQEGPWLNEEIRKNLGWLGYI